MKFTLKGEIEGKQAVLNVEIVESEFVKSEHFGTNEIIIDSVSKATGIPSKNMYIDYVELEIK